MRNGKSLNFVVLVKISRILSQLIKIVLAATPAALFKN